MINNGYLILSLLLLRLENLSCVPRARNKRIGHTPWFGSELPIMRLPKKASGQKKNKCDVPVRDAIIQALI